MTLHDQLLAVITARLETARAATPGPWEVRNSEVYWISVDGEETEVVEAVGPENIDTVPATAEHIASWDPTTAIRVLEALQEEITEHSRYDMRPSCVECEGDWPCRTLRRWARALGVDPTVTGGDE